MSKTSPSFSSALDKTRENAAKLDAIVEKAKQAIGDMPGIWVSRMFYMSMDSFQTTPEMVMVQVRTNLLPDIGRAPRAADFRGQPDHITVYKASRREWDARAKAKAQELFDAALTKLRAAHIRYRTGSQYGWPIARLA
jgi:LmbE family N-acetylglucosaminyl deacetylase